MTMQPINHDVSLRKAMHPARTTAELIAEINRLPHRNTASIRKLRRGLSRRLSEESPDFVLEVASALVSNFERRWIAYELIANHKETYQRLDRELIEQLGQGIDSWHAVDGFGRILSGPAWRDGLIDDATIVDWAISRDRWWRRTALVSTVALNMRSQGGMGDSERTLAICQMLADDHDDMVVKALSWALRELVVHDAQGVREFLGANDDVLAARVKREVRNKLETGLKNR